MNQPDSKPPPSPFPDSALPFLFPAQKIPLIPSSNPVNPVKNSAAFTYDFGGALAATGPIIRIPYAPFA